MVCAQPDEAAAVRIRPIFIFFMQRTEIIGCFMHSLAEDGSHEEFSLVNQLNPELCATDEGSSTSKQLPVNL